MMGVFVQLNEGSPWAEDRPVGYIICENGCWEWVGCRGAGGYSVIREGGRNKRAHRVMYERFKGPIPTGLYLDHLCRKRDCVNPDHLEPVTHKENCLRGVGYPAQQARKTHCKHGHPFVNEGTRTIGKSTWRYCLTCRKRLDREYRQRKRRRNNAI